MVSETNIAEALLREKVTNLGGSLRTTRTGQTIVSVKGVRYTMDMGQYVRCVGMVPMLAGESILGLRRRVR